MTDMIKEAAKQAVMAELQKLPGFDKIGQIQGMVDNMKDMKDIIPKAKEQLLGAVREAIPQMVTPIIQETLKGETFQTQIAPVIQEAVKAAAAVGAAANTIASTGKKITGNVETMNNTAAENGSAAAENSSATEEQPANNGSATENQSGTEEATDPAPENGEQGGGYRLRRLRKKMRRTSIRMPSRRTTRKDRKDRKARRASRRASRKNRRSTRRNRRN